VNFLKGLGTFVCSFLLFLALGIFSLAYMLHSTVLSADFVNKQVNRIDISSIAHDVAEKQIGNELPAGADVLKDVAYDVIAAQQPWIKQQVNNAVDTGYDYFLHKTNTLTITIPLADIKASLSSSLWDATQNYLEQKLAGMTDSQITAFLQDFIREIPADILPPELTQLAPNIRNIAIEEYLREFAGQKSLVNVPPEVSALVLTQVKQYFNDYLAEFTKDIPNSYTIDENSIGPDGMRGVNTARRIIGDFQAGYIWLIVFMVVMAGLIFVINLDVKKTLRTLGIDLLVFGALDLAVSIVARVITPSHFIPASADIPVSVQNIIDNVTRDVATIALIFSIGVLVVGAVLLAVSFIVKSKPAQA
jgi:hypothetical protein